MVKYDIRILTNPNPAGDMAARRILEGYTRRFAANPFFCEVLERLLEDNTYIPGKCKIVVTYTNCWHSYIEFEDDEYILPKVFVPFYDKTNSLNDVRQVIAYLIRRYIHKFNDFCIVDGINGTHTNATAEDYLSQETFHVLITETSRTFGQNGEILISSRQGTKSQSGIYVELYAPTDQ